MKQIIFKIGLILTSVLFGIVLIFCTFYLVKNYPRPADHFEMAVDHPQSKVLIATQGSEFKDAFVNQLTNRLHDQEYFIRGIEVDDLKDIDPGNWDNIVIINSFIVKLNRKVRRFLETVPDPDKVILLVTAGGGDWVPEQDLEVDALTCASHLEYNDALVGLMEDWITSDNIESWEPENYITALQFYAQVDAEKACDKIYTGYKRYISQYPKLDSRINQLGYYLMRIGELDKAREVFELNIRLFPENANVYDSYGEYYVAIGQLERAKKYYQKALSLDPHSESAQTALKKLRS